MWAGKLTRAVTKTTSIRAIGLCHDLFGTLGMLSSMFDMPEVAINVMVAGRGVSQDLRWRGA